MSREADHDESRQVLEWRCWRWLRAYPKAYRRAHGKEIVATLVDVSRPGQERPDLRQVVALVTAGLRRRAGTDRPPPAREVWANGVQSGALLLLLVSFLTRAVALAATRLVTPGTPPERIGLFDGSTVDTVLASGILLGYLLPVAAVVVHRHELALVLSLLPPALYLADFLHDAWGPWRTAMPGFPFLPVAWLTAPALLLIPAALRRPAPARHRWPLGMPLAAGAPPLIAGSLAGALPSDRGGDAFGQAVAPLWLLAFLACLVWVTVIDPAAGLVAAVPALTVGALLGVQTYAFPHRSGPHPSPAVEFLAAAVVLSLASGYRTLRPAARL